MSTAELCRAQTVWTNGAGTTWGTAGNWNSGIPGATSAAYFTNFFTNTTITIDVGANRTFDSLIFSGTNAYTFNNNRFRLQATTSTGIVQNSSADVTVNSTIRFDASKTFTGNGAGLLSLNGIVSQNGGPWSFTKDGTFSLYLGAANTFSGGFIHNGGAVIAGNNAAFGASAGTLTINGGGTSVVSANATRTVANNLAVNTNVMFVLTNGNDFTFSSGTVSGAAGSVVTVTNTGATPSTLGFSGNGFTYNGNFQLLANTELGLQNGAGTQTFAGLVYGAGSTLKSGGGTSILSVSNAYTGGTIIQAGELIGANVNALGGRDVTFNTAAGILGVRGGNLTLSNLTATSAATLQINEAAATALNRSIDIYGTISGAGGVTVGDGVNTTGVLTLNLLNTNATHTAAINLDGGTAARPGVLQMSHASGTQTLSGIISGAGGTVLQSNTGTTILSGINTYGGGTIISNGVLVATGNNSAMGSGNVTLAGGTNRIQSLNAVANNFNFNGGVLQAVAGSSPVGLFGVITMNSNGVIITDTNITLGNAANELTGSGMLIKEGAEKLILGFANNNSGGIQVNAGTLEANNAAAMGSGTLTMNGGTLTANGSYTYANALNVLTNSYLVATNGNSYTFSSGSISGQLGATFYFTNTGAGTSSLNLTGNGFDYQGGLFLSGPNSTKLSFQNAAGSQTFSGHIYGSGSVERITAGGTTVFAGDNTYTGGTLIQAGTLETQIGDTLWSSLGSGVVTLNGGNWRATTRPQYYSNSIVVQNPAVSYLIADTNLILAGQITGTGTLNKSGLGLVTMSNLAMSGGTLNIGYSTTSGGPVLLTGPNAGLAAAINVGSGVGNSGTSTLRIANASALGAGAVTINGDNANDRSMLYLDNNILVNKAITINTLAQGNQSDGVAGLGSWSGTNTYNGTITLNGNAVAYNVVNFDVQANSTLILGTAATAARFALPADRYFPLAKIGAGTLIISNVNYTFANANSYNWWQFREGTLETVSQQSNLTNGLGNIYPDFLGGTWRISTINQTYGVNTWGSGWHDIAGQNSKIEVMTNIYLGLQERFQLEGATTNVGEIVSITGDGYSKYWRATAAGGWMPTVGAAGRIALVSGILEGSTNMGSGTETNGDALVSARFRLQGGTIALGQDYFPEDIILAVGGGTIMMSEDANTNGIANRINYIREIGWDNNAVGLAASAVYDDSYGSGSEIHGGPLTFNIADVNDSLVLTNNPLINGDGNVAVIRGSNTTVTVTGNGTLVMAGTGTNTYMGNTYVNGGTLALNKPTGINAFRTNLIISNGTAILWNGNQIADTALVEVHNQGTFNYSNFTETVGGLRMSGGTITGGTGVLTLNGNVVGLSSTNTPSIYGNLNLGGTSRTFTIDGNMNVGAVITNGGLIKEGTGVLNFIGSNANTYTGQTVINAGTLDLRNPSGVVGIAGSVLINSNGTLSGLSSRVAGLVTNYGTLSPGGASGVGTMTFDTNLVLMNSSTSLFNFLSTTSFDSNYVSGVLIIQPNAALNLDFSYDPTPTDSFAIFQVGSSNISGLFTNINFLGSALSGQFVTNANGSVVISNVIAANYVWDSGASDNNWSSRTNWFGDNTPVNDGRAKLIFATNSIRSTPFVDTNWFVRSLLFTNNINSFTMSGSNILIKGQLGTGIVQNAANAQRINNSVTLATNQLWLAGGGDLVLGGVVDTAGFNFTLAGISNFIFTNGSSLVLSNNSLHNRAGSLVINGTGSNGTGVLRSLGGNSVVTGNVSLLGLAGIGVDSGMLLMSNTINGAGDLVKVGAGTLNLLGANTYSGSTTVSNGTLLVGSAQALGSANTNAATGTRVISGGTLSLSNNITITGELLTLAGNGVGGTNGALNNLSGNNRFNSPLVLSGNTLIVSTTNTLSLGTNGTTFEVSNAGNTLTLNGAGDIRFNSSVSGTGGLIKNGTGTSTLAGASNSFTGDTYVYGGVLVLNTSNSHPGNVIIGDGVSAGTSTLRYEALNNQLNDSVGVTVNNNGLFNLNGMTDTIGSLTLSGGSVQTLAGKLTMNGSITSLNNSTTASINGNLGLGASTRTIYVEDGSNPSDLLINGPIDGAGGVLKTGSGTLTYGGTTANTYTGITTVSNGVLNLAKTGLVNALGGNVIVHGSAEMVGSGAIAGLATNNGNFNPGSALSAGTFTFGSNLFLTAASTSSFQFFGLPSGSFDSNFVAGTMTPGGVLNLDFQYDPTPTDMFVIYQNATLGSGSFTATNWLGNVYSGSVLQVGQNIVLSNLILANYVWDGEANNNLFSSPTNWVGDIVPPNDGRAKLIFGANNLRTNAIADTPWYVRGLVFSNNVQSYLLTGSNVTIETTSGSAYGIVQNNQNLMTISNNIILETSQSWSARRGDLSLGGTTRLGTNTLILEGGSNFIYRAGSRLELSNGTVNVNAGLILNGSGPDGNGVLRSSGGNSAITGGISFASASTIGVDAGTLTHTGSINGGGNNITKVGAGTLTLTGPGTNSNIPNFFANGGTVELNKAPGVTAIPGNLSISNATVSLLTSNQIADTAAISFQNDAILKLNGNSETVGNVTNFGTSGVVFDFGSSSFNTLFKAGLLNLGAGGTNQFSVYNWSGTAFTLGGADQFILSNNLGVLTNIISFYSDSGITLLGDGRVATYGISGGLFELIPIPEPQTYVLMVIGLIIIVAGYRRRKSLQDKKS
ncbi:MAG: autotransporter-associated beta strand repeat-containing protein [Verrucomicrobiota bacterium]|nr:autotransporter-associated beta strand repeat-containing protein [Verrucomicrobiota bacterium]